MTIEETRAIAAKILRLHPEIPLDRLLDAVAQYNKCELMEQSNEALAHFMSLPPPNSNSAPESKGMARNAMMNLLAARMAYEVVLNQFSDGLGELVPNFDYDDITMDAYDNSIEFGGVPNGCTIPCEVAQEYIFPRGFQRMWLNHQDGSETYYWFRDGAVTATTKRNSAPSRSQTRR